MAAVVVMQLSNPLFMLIGSWIKGGKKIRIGILFSKILLSQLQETNNFCRPNKIFTYSIQDSTRNTVMYVVRNAHIGRSHGNKDQSGLSHQLHNRETLCPPPAWGAQSTNYGPISSYIS